MSNSKPIFDVPRPAVFAHRGGAAEVPESTIAAFLHALCYGADIIEVDIQLSRDGEPVVWHGPKLDITEHADKVCMKGSYVSCWEFEDLRSKLLVRSPDANCKEVNVGKYKICNEHTPDRRLMSLRQLVQFIKDAKTGKCGPEFSKRPIHLNIELKKTEKKGNCKCTPSWTHNKVAHNKDEYPYLHKVLNTLNGLPNDVTVVVGSADHQILSRFREIQNNSVKTNLSLIEQLAYAGNFETKYIRFFGRLGFVTKYALKLVGWVVQLFVKKKGNLCNFAFETPSSIVTKELVNEVHKKDGSIYVFLSPFPYVLQPEEDYGCKKDGKHSEQTDEEFCDEKYKNYCDRVKRLLDLGVDGLMTDYPAVLNRVLK